MKTRWGLQKNPFPAEAIARLGGTDARENGLLFDPNVQPHKMREVVDKFVLGAIYWASSSGTSGPSARASPAMPAASASRARCNTW